jgi:TetR/AcrR family transcriptional regulator of autoinduction and epiphytic fitness
VTTEPLLRLDGRLARAQRTRAAVIEALLALIEEGDLRPTAPRVAERAGVSLRSVFQHFADMEALVTEASDVAMARVQPLLVPLPTDGPLALRVGAWAAQRARVYEAVSAVRRASALQEPFSQALARMRQRTHHWSEAEIEAVFAGELASFPQADRTELLATIEAATSGDVWDHLRLRTGLDADAARRSLERILLSLLTAPEANP